MDLGRGGTGFCRKEWTLDANEWTVDNNKKNFICPSYVGYNFTVNGIKLNISGEGVSEWQNAKSVVRISPSAKIVRNVVKHRD